MHFLKWKIHFSQERVTVAVTVYDVNVCETVHFVVTVYFVNVR